MEISGTVQAIASCCWSLWMAKKYRFRIAYGEPVDQHMYMDLYDIGSVMTRHIEKAYNQARFNGVEYWRSQRKHHALH